MKAILKEVITLMRLYSNTVTAILVAINTALAQQEVSWLVVLLVNIAGLVIHAILREVPQPAVKAKLETLREERSERSASS